MTEIVNKVSSCPICKCPTADIHQLAAHLFDKSQSSDAQHVMWLSRNVTKFQVNCGRDHPFERPAQIPACGTTALGSCLEYERRSVHLGKDASHGQAATTVLPDGSSGSS